jgi:hypothetical protein
MSPEQARGEAVDHRYEDFVESPALYLDRICDLADIEMFSAREQVTVLRTSTGIDQVGSFSEAASNDMDQEESPLGPCGRGFGSAPVGRRVG